jgi:hypothetical protein
MNATMEEACLAMDLYGSSSASSTHPAKRSRIAAIVNGWKEAMEDNKKNNITEVVSPTQSQNLYVIDVVGEAKFLTLRNRKLKP